MKKFVALVLTLCAICALVFSLSSASADIKEKEGDPDFFQKLPGGNGVYMSALSGERLRQELPGFLEKDGLALLRVDPIPCGQDGPAGYLVYTLRAPPAPQVATKSK